MRGDLRVAICEDDLGRFARSGSQVAAFDEGRREEAAAGPTVQQYLTRPLGQLGGQSKEGGRRRRGGGRTQVKGSLFFSLHTITLLHLRVKAPAGVLAVARLAAVVATPRGRRGGGRRRAGRSLPGATWLLRSLGLLGFLFLLLSLKRSAGLHDHLVERGFGGHSLNERAVGGKPPHQNVAQLGSAELGARGQVEEGGEVDLVLFHLQAPEVIPELVGGPGNRKRLLEELKDLVGSLGVLNPVCLQVDIVPPVLGKSPKELDDVLGSLGLANRTGGVVEGIEVVVNLSLLPI